MANWRNSSSKVEKYKTHKIISWPGTPVIRISVEISEWKKGLKSKSFFQLMDFVCQWDWCPFARGHKFNYYEGKQAGCQIQGGVFLNKFSNLHRAHPLLISRNSPYHHDFVCLVWALEILYMVMIELLTIRGNRISLIKADGACTKIIKTKS